MFARKEWKGVSKKQVRMAQTRHQLLAIIKGLGQPHLRTWLLIWPRRLWLSSTLALVAINLYSLYLFVVGQTFANTEPWDLTKLSLVVYLPTLLITSLMSDGEKRNRKDAWLISEAIHRKNYLLTNNLAERYFDKEDIIPKQIAKFLHLQRPRRQQWLESVLTGDFTGGDHRFKFYYFHISYILFAGDHLSRQQLSSMPGYRRRFGIMVPFPFADDIIISAQPTGKFRHMINSQSLKFNENLIIETNNKVAAKNFLVPKIIIEIDALNRRMSDFSMEIQGNNILCISFEQQGPVISPTQYDLSEPKKFYREVNDMQESNLLKQLQKSVHTIMKYSDNNFEQEPDLMTILEPKPQLRETL
jgi:hypothetical protein